MSKAPLKVPEETRRLQGVASDPSGSAWVSANAGSGKTHVLAQRVIRLLLSGCDPSKILCLTYTRAAAANMANRVFGTLSQWTMLDDAALAAKIAEVEGATPGAAKIARARRLFAEALETPGGLKIQTIHAFCEALLHQFPLEANIAAHFEMLDSRMEEALFSEARRAMLTGASADPRLGEAFAAVLERGGETGLDTLLSEIVSKRDALRVAIDRLDDASGDFRLLFEEFGFGPGETAATIAAGAWPLLGFDPGFAAALIRASEAVDARKVLETLVPALRAAAAEADPARRLGFLAAGFLTTKGELYKPSHFKQALLARLPDLPDRYAEAAARIRDVSDRAALFSMLEGTRAALALADWMIGRYQRMKAARGVLDFNDLITRTVNLLARPDAGPWVQYKLDQGIDHILLDEAQDTSPDQWQVVRSLAAEFFAGEGARSGVRRTIFAVGDEKQSIYSFQGAAPDAFDRNRQDFSVRVRGAEGRFETVRLRLSFRSTDDVLHAVDRVFADGDVRKGVTTDPDPIQHNAIREGAPGYVEVWPSIGPESVEEPDDWTEAIDHAKAPAVVLANRIAASIRDWLARGDVLEGWGRPVRPGDIMVLVRKRDRFVHALSRALKDLDVPVAGADRLSLPAHLAVQDLIALARFLVQPEDDLSLAAVLKSPIFGLDEDGLYALAARRAPGVSLAASMRAASAGDAALAEIVGRLDRWADEAAFKPPFAFFAALLGRDGLRRRLVARLGHEAGDILDEFLSFCLAEERTGLTGIDALIATLESAGPEIKREMDQAVDEVRIMTVHAAKGLEAKVVFLVDSGSAPVVDSHVPRLVPFDTENIDWRGRAYLWRASGDVTNGFSRAASDRVKERAAEEYRRLLYVGMTRAEDRLILCGYHGVRGRNADRWHALVERALAGDGRTVATPDPASGESVLRFQSRTAGFTAPAPEDAAVPFVPTAPPPGLFRPLPPVIDLPRPLSPSGAAALIDAAPAHVVSTRSPVLDGEREPSFAVVRGLVLHKMLQILPGLHAADRAAAATRYLDRAASDWPASERQAALERVLAILDHAAFAPLFSDGSRAEVAVAGRLVVGGTPRIVSGKVDRLAVTADAVLIVDYKTNRPAPATLAQVPEAYLLQLGLYRALLGPLYPGRRVDAALLFTEAPRLIPLPAAALDAALARLGAA